MKINLNGYQIKRLLDFMSSDDESEIVLEYCEHGGYDNFNKELMPKGLYAWFYDYPEEGCIWLTETEEELKLSNKEEYNKCPHGVLFDVYCQQCMEEALCWAVRHGNLPPTCPGHLMNYLIKAKMDANV